MVELFDLLEYTYKRFLNAQSFFWMQLIYSEQEIKVFLWEFSIDIQSYKVKAMYWIFWIVARWWYKEGSKTIWNHSVRKTIQVHIRICVSARKTIIHLKMLKKKSRYQITNTMTSISGFGLCVSCYNSCHIIAYIKKFKCGILALSISLHSFRKSIL